MPIFVIIDPGPDYNPAITTTGLSIENLMNDVAAKAPDQWMNVGIMLRISYERLNSIDNQHRGDPMRCYAAVFSEWEKIGTLAYTWETIINVLESNLVKKIDLAKTIKKKYM